MTARVKLVASGAILTRWSRRIALLLLLTLLLVAAANWRAILLRAEVRYHSDENGRRTGLVHSRWSEWRWGPHAGEWHGACENWDEQGRLLMRSHHRFGQVHGVTTLWNPRGEIVSQYLVEEGMVREHRKSPPWFPVE